jgi:hypothetical protein
LLAPRDAQCLFEDVLGFFEPVETEQRNPLDATKLGLPLAVTGFLLDFQALHCRVKSRSILSLPRQRFCQMSNAVEAKQQGAQTTGEPLAQTDDSVLQRPQRAQRGTA